MMEERKTTLYRNGIEITSRYYWNDLFYSYEKGENKHEFIIKKDIEDPEIIYMTKVAIPFLKPGWNNQCTRLQDLVEMNR
jgi:hypothetical protein